MVVRHGYARGTGEKLIEFLAAHTHGRAVVERPHCTEVWERRDHLLIRMGELLLRGHIALKCGREETIYLYVRESTILYVRWAQSARLSCETTTQTMLEH